MRVAVSTYNPLPVDLNAVPAAIQTGLWSVWKGRPRRSKPNKWDKIPYQLRNPAAGASTKEPGHWGEYAEATKLYRSRGQLFDGLARLVQPDGIICLDLDGCVERTADDQPILAPWAAKLMQRAGTYCEFSPSGHGLRLFGHAELRREIIDHAAGIEIYDGRSARFVTVTGQRVPGSKPDLGAIPKDLIDELDRRHGHADDAPSYQSAPEFVDELPNLEERGIPIKHRQWLEGGFDGEDRSRDLQAVTKAMYASGLSDAEVYSTLCMSDGAMEVARSHRRGDDDRAWSYLWRHHCLRGRTASPFGGFDSIADNQSDVGGGPPLESFLARYVFVETGNLVADLSRPAHECVSRLDEFRNATSNVAMEVAKPTKRDADATANVAVHKLWMTDPARKTARGVGYDPDGPRVLVDDYGLMWVNMFCAPEFPRDGRVDALDVFDDHMAYLIPNERERHWFTDWLAFNIQRPALRSKVTPLHVSPAHGTGRGWVVELLQRLLGAWNVKKAKMDQLAGDGPGGAFHDYLHHSLVCAVEEVREGTKRFGVSDRMRDLLTEGRLQLNLKYGAQGTMAVHTNFFFMSNHVDALVLGPEDRRIQVLTGPTRAKDPAYYEKLYAWLNGPGVGQLWHWLAKRDIGAFNWTRSTDTPGRARMITSTQSDTERCFRELLEEPPAKAMTFGQIQSALERWDGAEGFGNEIHVGQLRKLLQQHCHQAGKLRVGTKTVRPWVLKDEALSSDEIKSAIQSVDV